MKLPTFRLLVEAHNVLRRDEDDVVRRYGFLQTFWIEAESADVAVQKALNAAAEQGNLREILANPADSRPVFTIYEVEQCSDEEIDEIEANPTGRAFYPEGLWSRVVLWYRRLMNKPYHALLTLAVALPLLGQSTPAGLLFGWVEPPPRAALSASPPAPAHRAARGR